MIIKIINNGLNYGQILLIIDILEDVKKSHENSQSLQVGIDLTEGQLGTDRDFEFYIKEAVVIKC